MDVVLYPLGITKVTARKTIIVTFQYRQRWFLTDHPINTRLPERTDMLWSCRS